MKVHFLEIDFAERFEAERENKTFFVLQAIDKTVVQIAEGQYVSIPPVTYGNIIEVLAIAFNFINDNSSLDEIFILVDEQKKSMVIFGTKENA